VSNGKSSKTESISISLEGDLIEILDHVCFLRDTSRSAFCRAAVKQLIAVEFAKEPSFWNRLSFGVKKSQSDKSVF
jgi:metal-responsive CopG/Arc/MetJ family transcriptional regulator